MGRGDKEGVVEGARVGPDAIGDAASEDDTAYTQALRAELARRLTELSRAGDGGLGRMGRLDGALSAALFVVLPIVAVLAAWRFL